MRRRTRLALAAVMAALMVAATLTAVIGFRAPAGDRPARPSPAGATPAPRGSGTARQASAPGRAHISLAGLRWAGFHGVLLPESAAAGPRYRRAGLTSGYADSPLGAVLAAVNIAIRATPQFGPRVFRPTILRQVTGPDAAALLAGCAGAYRHAAASAHVTRGRALGPAYAVEQGFRIVSWSPVLAVIDIASAGPGPGGVTARAATRTEVVWQRGDWRLVAPPGGDWAAAGSVLRSMAGFTLFPLPSGGH